MDYSERKKIDLELEFNGFLNVIKMLKIDIPIKKEEDLILSANESVMEYYLTEFYDICRELGFNDYGNFHIVDTSSYEKEGTDFLKAWGDTDNMRLRIMFGHHSLHMALNFEINYGSYFEIEVLYGDVGLLMGNYATLYHNSDGEFDIDKVVAKLKEEMIYVAEEQIKDLEGQIKELKEVKKSNIIQLR